MINSQAKKYFQKSKHTNQLISALFQLGIESVFIFLLSQSYNQSEDGTGIVLKRYMLLILHQYMSQ